MSVANATGSLTKKHAGALVRAGSCGTQAIVLIMKQTIHIGNHGLYVLVTVFYSEPIGGLLLVQSQHDWTATARFAFVTTTSRIHVSQQKGTRHFPHARVVLNDGRSGSQHHEQ
jgi:hypothetical protein